MTEKLKKAGLRRRKGITVVEVAVALAVISIVSAAAVGLILNSVNVEAKFQAVTQVQNQANSVLDCFRFSSDEDTFSQALQHLGEYTFDPQSHAYTLTDGAISVTVKASFAPKKLEFAAAKKSGEEIYTFTFPAEGGAT